MKKQIITIASILAFSTLAFAKPCTTENVGNSAGESMQTTWVSGQGSNAVVIVINYTFGKATGTISQNGHVVSILGVKQGKFIYDDLSDEYGSWDISCDMNQNNNVLTTDGSVKFVLRSSLPIGGVKTVKPAETVKGEPVKVYASPVQKIDPALGDWAPVAQ